MTYIVPINESGQWGTYWVHAHDGGAYTDGLRAPLVIHPEEEVYANEYDEEFTVVLGDWYHEWQGTLLESFFNIANPGGAEPIPRKCQRQRLIPLSGFVLMRITPPSSPPRQRPR